MKSGNSNKYNKRVGEEKINSFGSKMIVKNYRKESDIDVIFPEYGNFLVTNKSYGDFKSGRVKSPFCRSVCGVGFAGVGNFPTKTTTFTPKSYVVWLDMIRRCYKGRDENPEWQPSYIGCRVCSEWHNYQTFCEWFYENYYIVDGERVALDKDILGKGCKVYSPDTCLFVPTRINNLFVKQMKTQSELPLGVDIDKKTGLYRARCRDKNSKKITIGNFRSLEEAFNAYKRFKESVIKDIASRYKKVVPEKLYQAMMDYEVEDYRRISHKKTRRN